MFKEVNREVDFPELEEKILNFWQENDIFQKSLNKREDDEKFVFFEGPPTANGEPHPGHILTRVMKDFITRYKSMDGYYVHRKGGWDTHGLPVELEVEKLLDISGKPQIEEYGVEEFIDECKESVFTYKSEWEKMTERIGFWLDLENPYVTYTDDYIESVWWAIKEIWKKDLLYKGYKVSPYCPRCGTSLSSHEVAQGYQEIEEPSIFVKVPLKDADNRYFLMWTTTPWTVPANVALAVHPELTYACVRSGGEELILAEPLLERVLGNDYTLVETFKGEEMEGWEYEPVFDYCSLDSPAYFVVNAEFVSLEEGTGIVHMAPAFGEDDMQVGLENDLPVTNPVDEEGKFKEEIEPWAGLFVKDADPEIIKSLKDKDLLYKVADYTHTYPFCWRCDTPLLYYAQSSWFIKMTDLKDRLLEYNSKINWYPEHIKEGRFGNFLENVVDWALSRERYWGTPLNVWICECCQEEHAVGSKEELEDLAVSLPDDYELHKPYVDDIRLECPHCSGHMERVPEVIDCWFDSGAMPFAQWHYPFEKEGFNNNFPADFISEAVDQTRGWFYSLLAISTLLFDQPAYKNVLVLGHILDEEGQKMSKSKGNVVDSWEVFDDYGADALRWYLYTANPPWNPSRFYKDAIDETQRRFMVTLWNVYAFFVLYARIDKTDIEKIDIPVDKRSHLDRWIISKLNNLIEEIRDSIDSYEIRKAALCIEDFVDDLSNWYVRRSRRRYWRFKEDDDKLSAYQTLYEVLVTLAKLLAPYIPFFSEAIYLNLVGSVNSNSEISVHLTDYPEAASELVDDELEIAMKTARKVVSMARTARNQAAIKIRQPLSTLYIKTHSSAQKNEIELLDQIIKEELNVREIKFIEGKESFVSHEVKPRFDILGPKYGSLMPEIASRLSSLNTEQLKADLDNEQKIEIEIDDQEIILTPDQVEVTAEEKEEFFIEEDKEFTVVLDAELTEELLKEGLAREMVNKIQFMRKEADFNIQDHIRAYYFTENELVKEAVSDFIDYIEEETLTDELIFEEKETSNTTEWKLNGYQVQIAVEKL